MLTPEQHRYIQICVRKVKENKTGKELAEEFGVSETTVKNAVSWGREKGVFQNDIQEHLEHHIQEQKASIALAERLLLRRVKYEDTLWAGFDSGGLPPDEGKKALIPAKEFAQFLDSIHTQRERLMELQGVYKKVVNITQVNQDTRVLIMPEKAGDWNQAMENFLGRRPDVQKALADGGESLGRLWDSPTDGLIHINAEDAEEGA